MDRTFYRSNSSRVFESLIDKKSLPHYAPSHKDVYKIVGTGVLDGP